MVGLLAWRASIWWGTRRPARRPGRLVIAITVLAAYLVPGSFFPRWSVGEQQAPPVFLLVVVGLPTLLTGLAAMGVLATSPRRPPAPAWLLPAGLAVLVAIGGVLYYQDGAVPYFLLGDSPLVMFVFLAPLIVALPAAVWTIVAIRGRWPYRGRVGLPLLFTLLLLVAGFVAAQTIVLATSIISRLVLYPMEYGQTYDGVAYVPGAVVFGLLLGHLAAIRLDRSEGRVDERAGRGRGSRPARWRRRC